MNKALKALKEIEWKNDLRDGQMSELCPICKRSRHMQHAQWCRLDRAIGLLERQPKCKTCGGKRKVPASDIDGYTKWLIDLRQEDEDTGLGKVKRTVEQKHQLYGMYVEHNKDNTKSCPDCAKQPPESRPEAVKGVPEAERPSTRPDVPPKAPEATRRAWDKMAKATKAGEFTKEVRTALGKPPERLRPITDYLFEACDRLDRLEAQVKHTVDYCKVQIIVSRMAISAAADITGLSYKTVSEWPEIDTKDCKTFSETYAKVKRIVDAQNEKA